MRRSRVRLLLTGLGLLGVALAAQIALTPAPGPATRLLPDSRSTPPAVGRASASQASQQQTLAAYGRLPLSFIPNAGQLDPQVRYYAQGSGYGIYATPEEVVLSFVKPPVDAEAAGGEKLRLAAVAREESQGRGVALALRFVGANPAVRLEGRERAAGAVNYLVGNDPARWRRGLATYRELVYRELWPGVDMVLRGRGGRLKYEFVVRPGARVEDIRLTYRGAERLWLDGVGDLWIETALGELRDERPSAYQTIGGRRKSVGIRYALAEDGAGSHCFAVGADFDPAHPLIIDPNVVYSTFLGGSLDDSGRAIAVDDAGNIYLTGVTNSPDFPTTPGAFDVTLDGRFDAFVTKLNAAGSDLVYSTFLGGSSADEATGIALDGAGNAYVTGTTASSDFPTTPGAFDTTYNGGQSDAFVIKLNATGSDLVYSIFLGGSNNDGRGVTGAVGDIAVDRAGNAHLTGSTNSPDFPTTPGAFDVTLNGARDAFVSKLDAAGSDLVHSTFLGGSSFDDGHGIAVDGAGNAYLTGGTTSTDFPTTTGAFDVTLGGHFDAFVTKLNAAGSDLVYSTFLGGSNGDAGDEIAVDGAGNVYVTGTTNTPRFPTTPGAFDVTLNGTRDAFVSKLDAAGSDLVYSTFLGGSSFDNGLGIAVDGAGNAYVTGTTESADFPTTPGAFDVTPGGHFDAFVTRLNAAGSDLVYSTFLGGSSGEPGFGIAVDGARNAYVTGNTLSSDFPTTPGAFDVTLDGFDAFVTKLVPEALLCSGVPASLVGTAGDDRITGTPGNDVIHGLGGNDVISGVDGEDMLCGGAGNDLIRAGNRNDKILGGPGDDTLHGNGGRDFLRGEDGEDTLLGGPGFDALSGNEGDDLLDGGTENDRCDGGPQVTGDVAQNCEVVVDVP